MRNRGPAGARQTDDDPFAELVRMVEDPGAFARGRYDLGRALQSRDAYEEPAAPSSQDRPDPFELDETLFGLSEPVTPRDTAPSETQAFAPERRDHYHDVAARPVVLDDFDELIAGEMAALEPTRTAAAQPIYDDVNVYDERDYEAFDPTHHAAYDAQAERPRSAFGAGSLRRRTMFFGGGVAALTLVGMFGAYTLFASPGSLDGDGGPILIKADAEPYKIAPADPGGRAVPNQNKAVYERVARGGPAAAPSQDMLISAAEEPIDLSFEDDSDLPGVMVGVSDLPSELGVEVAALEGENQVEPVLQPRRVQTFDVRADGTLVPRSAETVVETPPAAAAPVEGAGPAVSAPLAPPPAVDPAPAPMTVEDLVATTAAPAASPVAPAATPAASPAPADAPAAEPVQTAALTPVAEPAPAAVPAGSYFVQISSQPSQELAEQSRQNLGSRYASAIGGRDLTIQSAEIPDKGTYYRVRVVASSKEEADRVCQSLQSAGGSCFVTR